MIPGAAKSPRCLSPRPRDGVAPAEVANFRPLGSKGSSLSTVADKLTFRIPKVSRNARDENARQCNKLRVFIYAYSAIFFEAQEGALRESSPLYSRMTSQGAPP